MASYNNYIYNLYFVTTNDLNKYVTVLKIRSLRFLEVGKENLRVTSTKRSGGRFEGISRIINNGAVRLIAGRREKNTANRYILRFGERESWSGGSIHG